MLPRALLVTWRHCYRALVVAYCMMLATAASIMSAGYFIEPGGTLDRLGDDAWLLSLPLLAAVVVGALLRPLPWGLVQALGAIALWYAMLSVAANIWPYTRDRFFQSRLPEFRALADAMITSGRIRYFWEWPDHQELNGTRVTVSPDLHADPPWPQPLVPLDSVLRRDGIDRAQYEAFRRQLRALHVRHFEADSDLVFLGERDIGFAYVPLHPAGLDLGDSLNSPLGPRRIARKFTDQWYYVTR